jgi:hypothetical protein
MCFVFMNLFLLRSDSQNVSATRMAIFRVVRARVQIYLQCVGGHYVIKLHL